MIGNFQTDQYKLIAPQKDRPLWKNYDLWSTIILTANALFWIFIRSPIFGNSTLFMVTAPHELMVHLPLRINPLVPHPEYSNRTIFGKRAWCNPLFAHQTIQGFLKKGKNMTADEYLPLQTRENPINKKFLKAPVVKKFIKAYETDSKKKDGRTTKYTFLGFRKMGVSQMMPELGLLEGAGWGIKKLELCIKKFPFGMYRKLRTDAIKANKTKSTPKTLNAIQVNTAGMKWAVKWMNRWKNHKVQNVSYDNFPCGQPDFCKLFRFGSELRNIADIGRAYGILWFFALIPIAMMLFDPPPAMPFCCDKIWHKYCAPFFPLCAAILMTAASACGFAWIVMQRNVLEREINTKGMQDAYGAEGLRKLRGLSPDADVQGFEFRVSYGMAVLYNLVPCAISAIIYWVLIFAPGTKYPRFPSRVAQRHKKFEEAYTDIKSRVLNATTTPH